MRVLLRRVRRLLLVELLILDRHRHLPSTCKAEAGDGNGELIQWAAYGGEVDLMSRIIQQRYQFNRMSTCSPTPHFSEIAILNLESTTNLLNLLSIPGFLRFQRFHEPGSQLNAQLDDLCYSYQDFCVDHLYFPSQIQINIVQCYATCQPSASLPLCQGIQTWAFGSWDDAILVY